MLNTKKILSFINNLIGINLLKLKVNDVNQLLHIVYAKKKEFLKCRMKKNNNK